MLFDRKQKFIFIAVIIALFGAGGVFLFLAGIPSFLSFFAPSQEFQPIAPTPTASKPPVLPAVAVVPPYRGEAVAAVAADPQFLKQVLPETDRAFRAELADIAKNLAVNPNQPPFWFRVAYIKHFYNDDTGARDAYEYLNIIDSNNPLPFYNLALLYGYNLKEPANAEVKFEAAIARNPLDPGYYIGFADFYREVMRDLPSAEQTLLAGLSKIDSTDFYIALGALYKTMGNKTKAIQYYSGALSWKDLGSAERQAITDEVARLKQ